MHVTLNETESRMFGRAVLDLRDVADDADLEAIEREYVADHDPLLAVCKAPIENVAVIHRLEQLGFRFVEFQLRMTYRPGKRFDTDSYPYRFELVTTDDALQPVLEIAATTFEDDRFSVDPWVTAGWAGERYRQYVRKSFRAADENVFRLIAPATGETLAFKTHRALDNGEVLHFLGGVAPKYKRTGLAVVCEYFELNALAEQGIKKSYTHISGRNYAVMNLELRGLGFRAERAFAVLRKWYAPCPGYIES